MALIVFLRGVNVGGHRRFRPSVLAKELSDYDVVNVGAAGTLIIRKPGPRAKFRAELLRRLPFQAEVMFCDSSDLLRLVTEDPFKTEPQRPNHVRFVSIRSKTTRNATAAPFNLPAEGEWFVRIIAMKGQFICGVYRRHMRTIGYLGQIDKQISAPVTTRNWNTILTIVRILRGQARTVE
jgi:uncharacterized protein (DUF1697 family)